MKVELKRFKEAGGDETRRFEALIYIDGKKAAQVSNDGCGGPNHYYWMDGEGYMPGPLGKQFHEFCKAQPHEFEFEVEDQYLDGLIEEMLNKKRLKRICSSKILCHLPGQTYKTDEWSTFKAKFTPETKAKLEEKYGAGIEFLNEKI